jgi:hypothetical protein
MSFRVLTYSAVTAILSAAIASAQAVSFTTTTYSNNNLWSNNGLDNAHIHADLNGDGREDFISENDGSFKSGCTGSFAITFSTGDGQYAAPVCYTIPEGNALYFATGDFDDDGTMDLAVTNDQGEAYIYTNDGKGNLSFALTLNLQAEAGGIVAADVNHDGHLDLVYSLPSTGTSQQVAILFGTGSPTVWNPAASNVKYTSTEPAGNLFIGDFDGDGNGDILVLGVSDVVDTVLYGNSKGSFTSSALAFSAHTAYTPADPNSNGTMALIGMLPQASGSFSKVLDLEEGHSDRQFTSDQITLKSCAIAAPVLTADFDGDGKKDILVAEDSDCKGDGPYTLNYLKNTSSGTGAPTFAAEQVIYSTTDDIFDYSVLRASHSTKPDITVWQSGLVEGNEIVDPEQLVLVNSTSGSFPSCTPSNYEGVGFNVCSPTDMTGNSSPVTLTFGGNAQTQLRDMEIWVDGTKVAESLKNNYSRYGSVTTSVPLSNGTHTAYVYTVGWDYMLVVYQLNFIVGSDSCAWPDYNSLFVCSPVEDSTVSSPLLAYAQAPPGNNIVRMEVWVDSTKAYSTFGTNVLKANITATPGWHLFTYYEVFTGGDMISVSSWAAVQ